MTNADQPIEERLSDVEIQLEELGDELDLIRTIQQGVRREARTNSQSLARLERTVSNLSSIARDHQVALRISQQEAERDRIVFQTEIHRIGEYLLRQGENGNTPLN